MQNEKKVCGDAIAQCRASAALGREGAHALHAQLGEDSPSDSALELSTCTWSKNDEDDNNDSGQRD